MVSEVSICNLALTRIGAKTIVSLTEKSEEARRCNIIYEQSRNAVLRDHAWSFATKIIYLSEIADESIVNWDYLYTIPANSLFIIKIFDQNNVDTNNYQKLLSPDTNTPCIATNIYQAYIKYIQTIVDPNLFDSLFVEALTYKLASELAMSITGDQNLVNINIALYNAVISRAKRADAQEKNMKIIRKSSFIDVR